MTGSRIIILPTICREGRELLTNATPGGNCKNHFPSFSLICTLHTPSATHPHSYTHKYANTECGMRKQRNEDYQERHQGKNQRRRIASDDDDEDDEDGMYFQII